jgi:hypothetical protein
MSAGHSPEGARLAASTEILIGDPTAQHVLIRPLSRSTPGLFDASDANGIDCEIEIAAGSFQGRLRADVRSEEFQTFLEQAEGLSVAVEGTASLTAIEGQLALSLSADGIGGIRLVGEAVDLTGPGNRLQFGFDVGQGALDEITRSVASLLAAFPVKAVPDA